MDDVALTKTLVTLIRIGSPPLFVVAEGDTEVMAGLRPRKTRSKEAVSGAHETINGQVPSTNEPINLAWSC